MFPVRAMNIRMQDPSGPSQAAATSHEATLLAVMLRTSRLTWVFGDEGVLLSVRFLIDNYVMRAIAKIALNYLAYHEGNGGYQRRSYSDKRWLLDAASQVQGNASRFAVQLDSCRRDLNKNWLQRLLS